MDIKTQEELKNFMITFPEGRKAMIPADLRDKARSLQSYLATKDRFFRIRKASPDSYSITITTAQPSQPHVKPKLDAILEELRKINERLDTLERNTSSILANTDKPIPF